MSSPSHTNAVRRMAVLSRGALNAALADALGEEFSITLVTPSPAAVFEAAQRGEIEAAALCDPEDGLGPQLEVADELLGSGIDVVILRPSTPHGIEGLGLVWKTADGRPLLFLPAGKVSPKSPLAKRLLDVLVSAAVLVLGSPVWLFIAVAVKLQDLGSVFFVQKRVGHGGQEFAFVKFRTMWPEAEAHRQWLERRHGEGGGVFKLRDDPRRTPVGRVLRRLSLDEAPQFVHVLAGQMSLVGPRPPLPSEVERYSHWQRMRLGGWFGLTGPWQVCGRSEVGGLDEITLLDLLYLRNHSLLLDLRIILRTVRAVLSGRGAY